jgi:hypothetical protein
VRDKVLKAFRSLESIKVPDKIDSKMALGFTFGFDLEKPDDIEELATMLHADLMRMAQAKRQIAKYAAETLSP